MSGIFGSVVVGSVGERTSDGWIRHRITDGDVEFLVDVAPAGSLLGEVYRAWARPNANARYVALGQGMKTDLGVESLAFLRARWAEVLAAQAEADRERAETERRADELARDVLTAEEYDRFKLNGNIEVPSRLFPEYRYKIGRDVWLIGPTTTSICVGPVGPLCSTDRFLSIVLLAKHDEAQLRATGAARWPA